MSAAQHSELFKWLQAFAGEDQPPEDLWELLDLIPEGILNSDEQSQILVLLTQDASIAVRFSRLVKQLQIKSAEPARNVRLAAVLESLIPLFPVKARKELARNVRSFKQACRQNILEAPLLQRSLLLFDAADLFRQDEFLELLYHTQAPLTFHQSQEIFERAGQCGIATLYLKQLRRQARYRPLFVIRLIENEKNPTPAHADLLVTLAMQEDFRTAVAASRVLGYLAARHALFHDLWRDMLRSPNRMRQLCALGGFGEMIHSEHGSHYQQSIAQFIRYYGEWDKLKGYFSTSVAKLLHSHPARCRLIASLGCYFLHDLTGGAERTRAPRRASQNTKCRMRPGQDESPPSWEAFAQLPFLLHKLERYAAHNPATLLSFMASLWLLADHFEKQMTWTIRAILDSIEAHLQLHLASLKYTGEALKYDQWTFYFHTCARFARAGLEGAGERILASLEHKELPLVLKGEAISELAGLSRIRGDVAEVFRQQIFGRLQQNEVEDPIILLRLLEFEDQQELESLDRLVKYSFAQVVALLKRFMAPAVAENIYACASRPLRSYLNGHLLKELSLDLDYRATQRLSLGDRRKVTYLRRLLSEQRVFLRQQLLPLLSTASPRRACATLRILRALYQQEPEKCFRQFCCWILASHDPHLLNQNGLVVGRILSSWCRESHTGSDPLTILRLMSLWGAHAEAFDAIVVSVEVKDLDTMIAFFSRLHQADMQVSSNAAWEQLLSEWLAFLKQTHLPTVCCSLCGAALTRQKRCRSCKHHAPVADYRILLEMVAQLRTLKGPLEIGHRLGELLAQGELGHHFQGLLRAERLKAEHRPVKSTLEAFASTFLAHLGQIVAQLTDYRELEFADLRIKVQALEMARQACSQAQQELLDTGAQLLDRPLRFFLADMLEQWGTGLSQLAAYLDFLGQGLAQKEPTHLATCITQLQQMLPRSEQSALATFLTSRIALYTCHETSQWKRAQLLALLDQLLQQEPTAADLQLLLPLLASSAPADIFQYLYPHILQYLQVQADNPASLARWLIRLYASSPPAGFFSRLAQDFPNEVISSVAAVVEGENFNAVNSAAEVVKACGPYIRMAPFLKVLARAGDFHHIEEFAEFWRRDFSPVLSAAYPCALEVARWAAVDSEAPAQNSLLQRHLDAVNAALTPLEGLPFHKIEERTRRLHQLRNHFIDLEELLRRDFPPIPEKALVLRAMLHWRSLQPGIERLLSQWQLLLDEIRSERLDAVIQRYASPGAREKLGLLPHTLQGFKRFLVHWHLQRCDLAGALAYHWRRPGTAGTPLRFPLALGLLLLFILLLTPLSLCYWLPELGKVFLLVELAAVFLLGGLELILTVWFNTHLFPLPGLLLSILVGLIPLLFSPPAWQITLHLPAVTFALLATLVSVGAVTLRAIDMRRHLPSGHVANAWNHATTLFMAGLIPAYLLALGLNFLLARIFITSTQISHLPQAPFVYIFPSYISLDLLGTHFQILPCVVLCWTLLALALGTALHTVLQKRARH